MNKLKLKIKDLPKSPGVYYFIGNDGGVLYVGKAKNLKNRVKQYFLKELNRGPAIDQMVVLANDIRWIETDSEIEAVILEADLINKLKPKYNIRLKDDKSFLVIKISKEDFPCVDLVRFRNVNFKDKNAEYFGPYPAGLLLKKSLRYLRKIFPFRDCSNAKFQTSRRKCRQCVYGDIGVCSAPCTSEITKDEYRRNILYLKNFLRGKKKDVISSLEKSMKRLSREKKFEQAVIMRNRIQALSHIKDASIGLRDDVYNFSSSIFSRIECYDISNIMGEHAVGSMVVFTNGKTDKDQYRRFKIRAGGHSDLERLKEVLERRFKNYEWEKPNLIVIDGGEQQLRVAKEVVKEFNLSIPIVSISKGPRRDKNEFHFSDQNIAKFFYEDKDLQNIAICTRDEAHRFAISYYRKVHEKELFQ
jgi:excinuclease ABC subunit C